MLNVLKKIEAVAGLIGSLVGLVTASITLVELIKEQRNNKKHNLDKAPKLISQIESEA